METVKHKIKIDLASRGVKPVIDAVQGDTETRTVEISLFENGVPWEIPSQISVLIKYKRSDGTGGTYNVLPNGNPAYSIFGNLIAVMLVAPILSKHGMIDVQLRLSSDNAILTTFAFAINAEKDAHIDGEIEEEDYNRIEDFVKTEIDSALKVAKSSGEFDGLSMLLLPNLSGAGVTVHRVYIGEFQLPDGYVPKVGDLVLHNDGYLGYIYAIDEAAESAVDVALFIPAIVLKGDKGDKGDKGETGATGATGANGKDGANGTPATHSWDGTILRVTSASGTSSADLQGVKGDTGATGATGPQGATGPKGDTGPQGPQGDPGRSIFYSSAWPLAEDESVNTNTIDVGSKTLQVGDLVVSANHNLYEIASIGSDGWLSLRYLTTLVGTSGGSGISVNAQPGQLIVVKEVDGNGNPTAWEAVDRTHWEEVTQEEVSYSANVYFKYNMANITGIGTDNVIPGKTYTVTWNGTEYECTAVLDGSVMLGNLNLMGLGDNTGEPFCMEMLTGNTALVYKSNANTETIAVNVYLPAIVKIHKLDPKFLPDGGGSSSTLLVTLNNTHDVASHNGYQIYEHVQRGGTVLLQYGNSSIALTDVSGGIDDDGPYGYATFVTNGTDESYIWTLIIYSDGNVEEYEHWYLDHHALDTYCIPHFPSSNISAGQTLVVDEVDANGRAQWKPVDLPTAGGGADWNAPEGEPGHVLNRTHYVEQGEVEFVAEQTVEFLPGYKVADVIIDETDYSKCIPIAGAKYVVMWNGERYECEGKVHELEAGAGWRYIGNGKLYAQTEDEATDTGEPFVYVVAIAAGEYVSSGVWRADVVDAVSIPFAIYSTAEVVHKLPGKFLPDGVPYSEVGRTDLLAESEASSFTHPAFGTMWMVRKAVKLNVGETYTVVYNGVSYECVCQPAPAGLIEDPDAVAMGNFSVVGGANTGEPFAMLVSCAYKEVDIIDLVGSSSVVVKIVGMGEIAHKIGLDMLPEEAINEVLIVRAATVDENGDPTTATHTAVEIWRAIYLQGKAVLFVDRLSVLPLFSISDVATFGNVYAGDASGLRCMTIVVAEDGAIITYKDESIQLG